jgi:hypothetical protein
MSTFDKAAKAIDKAEESISEAREKSGLGPDDQSEVTSETDMSGASTTHTDDTIKDD